MDLQIVSEIFINGVDILFAGRLVVKIHHSNYEPLRFGGPDVFVKVLPVFASCQTRLFGRRALELIRVFQDWILWLFRTVDSKNGVFSYTLFFVGKGATGTGYCDLLFFLRI
jgi:hypothetical protein